MSDNTQIHSKTYKMVGTALLAALVVVLQVISSYVKFGPFSITLTLIPVVIGGIVFGVGQGAFLGALFGVVVTIFCILGVDQGGYILFSANPFLTILLCVGKGTAAGAVSALIYRAFAKKGKSGQTPGVILSVMAAPIVNTGIFLLGMFSFFYDILIEWAGGTKVAVYILTTLVGINFLVEFAVNAIFSMPTASVILALQKDRKHSH